MEEEIEKQTKWQQIVKNENLLHHELTTDFYLTNHKKSTS